MIFSINNNSEAVTELKDEQFADLDIWERRDLQEWVIDNPRILGEDLLVVTSEYDGFEGLRDRLDVLALTPDGKLVVVELKRDNADDTTDLQAIKYASYCATLTAEDIQNEYREFWQERDDEELTPGSVGEKFNDFLQEGVLREDPFTEDGWAAFDLGSKPRIVLAAGEFGTQVTAPVMWLIEEYGMDITCTKIDAYDNDDEILLDSQQIIPVKEAEEYMTRRREKEERQDEKRHSGRTITLLLDRELLSQGDEVVFTESYVPDEFSDDPPVQQYDESDDFWRARITGKKGQSDNVEWLYDNKEYSFTGLSKELLRQLAGRDSDKALNGYKYWTLQENPAYTLDELRDKRSLPTVQDVEN
ncbi:DUF91 domain-containing protein [Salinirubrum litoreum]|uniref:DUF91 domain-containing protein n=1 Tax=Salinirubrum litoreum TaxID=1126234 RepID=A0ABD5RCX7_9EURY|nr:DUF91 domain-containing protein [Salinirubrum litoreum]